MSSKSLLEVLQSTTGYFEKHGVESPRLNAEHLVAHILGKKRIDLYMEFDRPLGERELAPLRELVKARAQGKPLQHLLGTVDFCGRIFLCDQRALIPRPETEQLIELVLPLKPARLLDVGTGSGVIAITLAAELPEAQIEATDISPDALALAAENAEKLGLAQRVTFLQGDLLEKATGQYDLIVANLPYIAPEEIATLSREVRHDPLLALDGGDGGVAIIQRLLSEARPFMRPGGRIALEIGAGQSDTLAQSLDALGWSRVEAKPDYQDINRFLLAQYG